MLKKTLKVANRMTRLRILNPYQESNQIDILKLKIQYLKLKCTGFIKNRLHIAKDNWWTHRNTNKVCTLKHWEENKKWEKRRAVEICRNLPNRPTGMWEELWMMREMNEAETTAKKGMTKSHTKLTKAIKQIDEPQRNPRIHTKKTTPKSLLSNFWNQEETENLARGEKSRYLQKNNDKTNKWLIFEGRNLKAREWCQLPIPTKNCIPRETPFKGEIQDLFKPMKTVFVGRQLTLQEIIKVFNGRKKIIPDASTEIH